jgi:hypothetical protein
MDDVRKLVKVKPLEWEKVHEALAGMTVYTADSPFGHYNAGIDLAEIPYWMHVPTEGGEDCSSLDAAKSAAQADYEARILAALTPASDGRAEGLREAAGIAEKHIKDLCDSEDIVTSETNRTLKDVSRAILARAAELEGKTDE